VEKGAVGHGGRPAGMQGWQGQPHKMVEYEHWQRNKPGCRSSGCWFQFGGAEKRPSFHNRAAKTKHTFQPVHFLNCLQAFHCCRVLWASSVSFLTTRTLASQPSVELSDTLLVPCSFQRLRTLGP
jgi:hypothetical protein